MKTAMALVAALLLTGCSTLKWDTTEKIMLGAMITAHAADGLTTSMAMSHGMTEANSMVYGSHASDEELAVVKITSIGLTALAADLMPSHGWRKLVLGLGTVPPAAAAIHNYNCLRGPY